MKHETGEARARRHLHGYAMGGHADAKADEAMIRKAIGEHDKQLHGGKHTRLKFKRGGHVEGGRSKSRPDCRARGGSTDDDGPDNNLRDEPVGSYEREIIDTPEGGKKFRQYVPIRSPVRTPERAKGGNLNGVVAVDRRYEAEGIDQPHGPEKRARGGKHGKPRIGAVNIGIKACGDDQAAKQMAARQGLQAGVQLGARAALQKMAGGAPRPPMAGPPGGMPPGAPPPGGPPMAGPPMAGPPGGAMPPRPPMARDGGPVRMRERSRERRVGS